MGGAGGGGGLLVRGALGRGGGGGGLVGIGAAAAGFAAPAAPTLILRSFMPGVTVEPSSTRRASTTPATGEGTGTEVLSVSISHTTSSTSTESPTAFSHLMSPSEMESAKGGHSTSFNSLYKHLEVKMFLL